MSRTDADIEMAFYDRFFLSKNLEPYPVQEEAFEHIFAGRNIMVTVPTGTGKTMMAKAALFKALQAGQTAVYTTPLRALTEEKYRELAADFGESKVGFATGDYKANRDAPIQVQVAEILWNEIFGGKKTHPADVVVMDEGHYFNDPERGYVWEQSIIGLDPKTQLVILSATVGHAKQFCQWVATTRQVPIELVESTERRVPLHHEYREQYVIEAVRALHEAGDTPAILFTFGRKQCFERARILKSCPRFTTDEEREAIAKEWKRASLGGGVAKELEALLLHGIGVHHAGILPRYKHLVEELTLARLLRFVVSTETIAAGLNLPARTVMFPSLRKHIKGSGRLLTSAEFHQMAGRAGRPQFDTEGLALALAPEEVVQEVRKEIKEAKKRGRKFDEEKLTRTVYSKAKSDAQKKGDVTWDADAHEALVQGQPAPLQSRTKVTAEMVLALGLPDLVSAKETALDLPPSISPNARTITRHLLLPDNERREAEQRLQHVTDNLRALGVIDEHGQQIAGEVIGSIRGLDGLFVYYTLAHHELDHDGWREMLELLVDHNVIHKQLQRKADEKKREWILERLRERRQESPQISFEDVEEEYEREFPRELSGAEKILQEFIGKVPHPELHGGKVQKNVWTMMQTDDISFMDFVEDHDLAREEGSLFSYLARLMKAAKMLHEVTENPHLSNIETAIRSRLAVIDERVMEDLW